MVDYKSWGDGVEGATEFIKAFIDSPHFWRAIFVVILLWSMKNARTLFDELHYVWDRLGEGLAKRRRGNNNTTNQMVAEILRAKAKDDQFDAAYAISLQERIIADKDSVIGDLESKLEKTERRNASLVKLAIENGEKNTQVIHLLNGTVGVFNTVAEELTEAIHQLCASINQNGLSK